jgi:hypothetical protein
MNQFTIDRARITRARTNPTALVSNGRICVQRRKRDCDQWINDPIVVTQTFGADIWQMQIGYDAWGGVDGKRNLVRELVPFGQTPPKTPIDGQPIYLLPIYSIEFGGRADLVINDRAGSEALADLTDEMDTFDKCHANPLMIPHLLVTDTEITAYGVKPIIGIQGWDERPDRWGAPFIKPSPRHLRGVSVEGDEYLLARLHELNAKRGA